MEISHITVTVNGTEYLIIESEDGERVTVLDQRLIPIGQVAVFMDVMWSGTRFRPDDFSAHAFHTMREALNYLIPGLANALLD